MTSIVRTPYCQVFVDGIEAQHRFSFRASYGYDLNVAECTVVLPYMPGNAKFWSWVQIRAGATQATARPVFQGLLVQTNYTLYPREAQLVCRGALVAAQLVECSTAGGVDLSSGGAGQTDQAIVTQLLTASGITAGGGFQLTIGGLGRTLGTVATKYYTWAENQSALDMIQQVDEICLGYRTYDTPSGGIARVQITQSPATSAALIFTEGVDIFSATPQVDILNTITRVQVTGYDPGTGSGAVNYTIEQSNPLMPFGYVTDQFSSNLIESSTTGGTGISAQEVATYRLQEQNRAIGQYTFDTPRDDVIVPGMTIAINAPQRLGVNQNFWVQHVDIQVDDKGVWTQTLICTAGLLGVPGGGSASGTSTTPSGGVVDGGSGSGTGGSGNGQGGNPPSGTPPTADFTIDIQSEEVYISGSTTLLYDVQCTAVATGTSAAIASYSWSCSAGTPTSSTADTYVFYVTSITGSQTISLTVTDANGNSTTVSHTLSNPGAGQIVTRKLYLAGTDCIELFDGTIWHTHSESNATVVTNAPVWGDSGLGVGQVWTSTDNLTTIVSTNPFSNAPVTALWLESAFSASRILAGSGTGEMAVSQDGGTTWTRAAQNVPGSISVLRCVLSGTHPNQWFALTTAGLYRTDNAGAGWVTVVAAAGGETFNDFVLSFARNVIVMTGGRKMVDFAGNAQTIPGGLSGNLIAVAAHIRKDIFYVLDSSGNTGYHATAGATTITAGTSLPGGSAQPRSLYRDGKVVDLLYVAAGSHAYKSIDGFRSSGGYFILRQAGVATAPSGAAYTQVGADGNLIVRAVAATSVQSAAAASTVYPLGTSNTPPANWQFPSFDDSAWSASVSGKNVTTDTSGALTTNDETFSTVSDHSHDGWYWLLRRSFTVPAGNITTATLTFGWDDGMYGVYLNGTFLYSNLGAYAYNLVPVLTIPKNLLVVGTNVLSFLVYNAALYTSVAYDLEIS